MKNSIIKTHNSLQNDYLLIYLSVSTFLLISQSIFLFLSFSQFLFILLNKLAHLIFFYELEDLFLSIS